MGILLRMMLLTMGELQIHAEGCIRCSNKKKLLNGNIDST